ncbi:MAG: recombinase RecT [Firmicutes bacterium]|nr:recombinase RecT [Bacillota bacterium]
MSEQTQVAKAEPSMSERFTNKVIAEFSGSVGEIALTKFQMRLAQNYFMAVDSSLRLAEEKRIKKSEKYRDKLPVEWANVNMEQLARSVVAAARVGLDPMQSNHIHVMPFKDNALKKYNIVFIDGYRGIELKAKKYGLDIPDHVIVELVYSSDKFKSIKKDRNNEYESYDFEIVNDFDRGEVVGGFYYHAYNDHLEKNKLVVMTIKEILKRKPNYASPEFWGGEKDKWENGKKVGKEQVEGWFEKMCYKTVYRAAYKDITIDSQKIDNDYLNLKQMEASFAEAEIANEIEQNANGEIIDIKPEDVTDGDTAQEDPAVEPEGQKAEASHDQPPQKPEAGQENLPPTGTGGPGF